MTRWINYYALGKYGLIAIAPNYCVGKPRIAGTRIPGATIAQLYLEMGENKDRRSAFAALKAIASHHEYALSLAAVYAAMAYYYDNQEEIDRHTAESRA